MVTPESQIRANKLFKQRMDVKGYKRLMLWAKPEWWPMLKAVKKTLGEQEKLEKEQEIIDAIHSLLSRF